MVEKRLISSSGGQTDAGQLDAGETALFEIVPGFFDPRQPLRIEAEAGGHFKQGLSEILLEPPAEHQYWKFSYTIGQTRGGYSLRLAQGQKEWRILLICGPNAPQGEPGPMLNYNQTPRANPNPPTPHLSNTSP
jgi:hypothetical protein